MDRLNEINTIEDGLVETFGEIAKDVKKAINIEETKQEIIKEAKEKIKEVNEMPRSVDDCERIADGDIIRQLELTWQLFTINNDWLTFVDLFDTGFKLKLAELGLVYKYAPSIIDKLKSRKDKDLETIKFVLDASRRFETVGIIKPQKSMILKELKAYVGRSNEADELNHARKLMGYTTSSDTSDITTLKSNKELIESILVYFDESAEHDELLTTLKELKSLRSKIEHFEDLEDFNDLKQSEEVDELNLKFNKRNKKELPCDTLESKKEYYLNLLDKDIDIKNELKNKLKVIFNSATQKRIVDFINMFSSDMLYASSFDNKKVFTKRVITPEGVEKNVSSNDLRSFTELYVKIDPKTKSTVLDMVRLILDLYPIGERGGFLKTLDKSTSSPIINKFAKFIDDQAGEGAFAAYMLYPILFNNSDLYNTEDFKFGIKRQFVAGIRPSTGKSILGKLLSLTYKNSLVFKIGPRQETSQSGYNAAKHNWNSSIINEKIIFIDDDNGDNKVRNASRADFWKNLYSENALTIGSRGSERTATFNGFAYSNTNYYGDDFEAEEVAKRVYILHLNELVNDHFDKHEIELLHKTDNPELNKIDRDALINYLNENIQNAINWFNNYKTPNEATQAELIEGTEDYDLINYILGAFKNVKSENPKSKIVALPLKLVKDYCGGYINGVKVTPTFIEKITQGRLEVKKTRFKVVKDENKDAVGYIIGTAECPLQQCVRFAPGIDFKDFEGFNLHEDLVESFDKTYGLLSQYHESTKEDKIYDLCVKVGKVLEHIDGNWSSDKGKAEMLIEVINMLNNNKLANDILERNKQNKDFDEDSANYESFEVETF